MEGGETTKPRKAHSKFRFTCFSSRSIPNVVVSYSGPTTFKVPTTTRVKAQVKSSQVQRSQQTPEQKAIADLFRKISQKDENKTFAAPVTEEYAPGYFNIIKEPMDLSKIKQKMHDETYTLSQFKDDVYLMIRNCMTYNPEQTIYYKEASKLYSFFKKIYSQEKQKLLGIAQQDVKSLARTANVDGQIQYRNIQSLSIPVKVKSFVKKPSPFFASKMSGFAPNQKRVFRQVPVANPNVEKIGDENRFNVFMDVILHNQSLRSNLQMLKQKYSREIMNDEIIKMAHLPPTFQIDNNIVDQALKSDQNDLTYTEVTDAPIDEYSLQSLVSQIPELKLSCFQQTNAIVDPEINSLRLTYFYQNMLRYWCDPNLDGAKKRVLKDLQMSIGKQIEKVPLSNIYHSKDYVVLMHILESIEPPR